MIACYESSENNEVIRKGGLYLDILVMVFNLDIWIGSRLVFLINNSLINEIWYCKVIIYLKLFCFSCVIWFPNRYNIFQPKIKEQ